MATVMTSADEDRTLQLCFLLHSTEQWPEPGSDRSRASGVRFDATKSEPVDNS